MSGVIVARDVGGVIIERTATGITIPKQPTRIEVTRSGPPGPAGPAGTPGEPGPPGTPGSAPQAYTHTQDAPSATWVITHNLGYHPAGVLVFDTAGSEWVPGVILHTTLNELVLQWSAPFSGVAYLS